MRLLSICAMAMVSTIIAAAQVPPTVVTIVLEFHGPHSEQSVDAMKHEVEVILKDAPLGVAWRSRAEVANAPVANLVVFRFKGKCILEPVGYLFDERGPLAFTYSTAGTVQPYSEVACDQVTGAVRPVMAGSDFAKADLLLGRALGRVVAHELVHMLSRSGAHGKRGITQPALTPGQLISPELHFNAAGLERIYTEP